MFIMLHLSPSFGAGKLCYTLEQLAEELTAQKFSKRSLRHRAFAQTRKNWDDFASDHYGELGEQALTQLRSIDVKGIEQLIVDPGIVQYIDEFTEFAQALPPRSLALIESDPWRLRDLFAKKLGKKRVVRALALTEAELAGVLESGMNAPGTRLGNLSTAIKNWVNNPVEERIVDHMGINAGAESLFVSVSENEDLAHAIASYFITDNSEVYIIDIELDKLDLIDPYHFRPQSSQILFVNGKKVEMDHRMESLVPFDIGVNEIKDFKKIPRRPAEFKFFDKGYENAYLNEDNFIKSLETYLAKSAPNEQDKIELLKLLSLAKPNKFHRPNAKSYEVFEKATFKASQWMLSPEQSDEFNYQLLRWTESRNSHVVYEDPSILKKLARLKVGRRLFTEPEAETYYQQEIFTSIIAQKLITVEDMISLIRARDIEWIKSFCRRFKAEAYFLKEPIEALKAAKVPGCF